MYIDVIPLFSSPLATSKLEVDAHKILEKLKTLEFELTDYVDEDVGTAGDIYISSSLSILDYFPELKTEIMLKLHYFCATNSLGQLFFYMTNSVFNFG